MISTGGAQHRTATANEETEQKQQMDSAAATLLNSANGAESKKKKKPANPRSNSIQEEAEFELVSIFPS